MNHSQAIYEKFARFLKQSGSPFWRMDVVERDGTRLTLGKYMPVISSTRTAAAEEDSELNESVIETHLTKGGQVLQDMLDHADLAPGTTVYLNAKSNPKAKREHEVTTRYGIPREEVAAAASPAAINLGYVQSREERLEDARREFIRWEEERRDNLRAERRALDDLKLDLETAQRRVKAHEDALKEERKELEKSRERFESHKESMKEGVMEGIYNTVPDLIRELGGNRSRGALAGPEEQEDNTPYGQKLAALGEYIQDTFTTEEELDLIHKFLTTMAKDARIRKQNGEPGATAGA